MPKGQGDLPTLGGQGQLPGPGLGHREAAPAPLGRGVRAALRGPAGLRGPGGAICTTRPP